jgi:mono/diheme cytochrome c family protein
MRTATFVLVLVASIPARAVDYTRDVKPILKDRCYACHGALKQESGLRVDTAASLGKAEVVKAGNAKESELVSRISAKDDARMPPEGKPLTPEQIAIISKWIEEGAKAPADEKPEEDPRKHWAFLKPVRPKVADGNAIDALLDGERKSRGLVASGEADRATLLRRVYYDLIGLPPTREQLLEYLNDTSPTAYEKVVDRLLASPQYGERWARHWMDVWRYSDWYGRRGVPDVLNSYGQIWRWRDWIVKATNEDRGYDRMIRDMLAADELTPTDDANIVATGFVVRNFYRWNYNNWMRDNVEHTAKAFLGLTFNCCHCHDHKYDPISQEEYFKLRAVFEPIEIRTDRWPGEADPGVYPKYSYGAAYKPISTGMVRVVEEKLDAPTRFYTGGDERNVAKDKPPIPPGVPASLGGTYEAKPVALPPEAWYPGLKTFVRDEERKRREDAVRAAAMEFENSRLQLARMIGRMILLPLMIGEHELADRRYRTARANLEAARDDYDAVQARIAADDIAYLGKPGDAKISAEAANRAEGRHAVTLARAKAAQAELSLAIARRTKAQTAQVPALEKQVATTKAAIAPLEAAAKSVSTKYTPLSHQYAKTTTGRRLALANWIANRDNPLTARVAVNHVWNWHFGRPLVETTNNFGRSGKAPTHPQLLDWLAVELMDNGWKFKPLHRLIVTSKAYRMASTGRSHPNDLDNVYLARFPSQRLDAECVRDGLLHVAGELDLAMGGPDIPQDQGLTSRRRSLYFTHHGEARMMFLDLFDAANPCDAYRRSAAVLPQQALALANSEFTLELSRKLTAKLLKTDPDTTSFVKAAFKQILARPASAAEQSAAVRFLERQTKLFEGEAKQLPPNVTPLRRAQESLVQALFNHTDFVTVR